MSTYAVSDLHGHLNLYNQIKAFLQPEDKVICLGDCGDRGPQSWETIRAVASDPQWTYLMGNHEHMLAGAMCEYLDDERLKIFNKAYKNQPMQLLCAYNGGVETLRGWVNEGANPDWIEFLMKRPYMTTYVNSAKDVIHLSHAGYTPDEVKACPDFDMIWGRDHFNDKWPKEFFSTFIVHGHTPVPYIASKWTPNDGAIYYAGGHKIDIDQGTYETGQTLLLDLDTFDEHIFRIEKEGN